MRCTFCSTQAKTALGGEAPEAAKKHETVYACYKSQHKTKARAYLEQRGYKLITERVIA